MRTIKLKSKGFTVQASLLVMLFYSIAPSLFLHSHSVGSVVEPGNVSHAHFYSFFFEPNNHNTGDHEYFQSFSEEPDIGYVSELIQNGDPHHHGDEESQKDLNMHQAPFNLRSKINSISAFKQLACVFTTLIEVYTPLNNLSAQKARTSFKIDFQSSTEYFVTSGLISLPPPGLSGLTPA